MNKKTLFKRTSLALYVAIAAGATANVHAVDFDVSGQISRLAIAADNGERTGTGFTENGNSPSRLRVIGEQEMDNGMTVGMRYELSWRENLSNNWDIDHGGANEGVSTDVRWTEGYVKGSFGKVSLGRGDGAANGITESDFSGNAFIGGGISSGYNVHGITMVDSDGNPIAKVKQAYSYFDALSRVSRLRYDSPAFGALTASVSADESDAYEGALSWSSTAPGGRFAAKMGYADSGSKGAQYYTASGVNSSYGDDKNNFETYGASAAYLHDSGLNLAVSYSKRDYDDRQDASNHFVGIGYRDGAHRFSVNMGQTKDLLNDGSKATAYGAAYAFAWTKSIELFASYHLLQGKDLNPSGAGAVDAEDVSALVMGTRIKFL